MADALSPRGVFDTHAHYTDARFEAEFDGGVDAAVSECFAPGMAGIINVGTNVIAQIPAAAMQETRQRILTR